MPILNDNSSERTLSFIVEIDRRDLAMLHEHTGIVNAGELVQHILDVGVMGMDESRPIDQDKSVLIHSNAVPSFT